MSQDARIFLVTGIIALVFMVIVPLLARSKRSSAPTGEGAGAAKAGAAEGSDKGARGGKGDPMKVA